MSELEIFAFLVRKEPFPGSSQADEIYPNFASERSERAGKFLHFLYRKEPFPATSRPLTTFIVIMRANGVSVLENFGIFYTEKSHFPQPRAR